MIGVKFNRAMRPFGAGDTALLPDSVAHQIIGEGAAERLEFPRAPHASEARPAIVAGELPSQTYKTKGRGK